VTGPPDAALTAFPQPPIESPFTVAMLPANWNASWATLAQLTATSGEPA
jgi:hypothetical protein